jgi:V8-like Glu-specific endopeptidase
MDYNRATPAVTSHTGTGFLIGKNIIVTCWHCVRSELKQGERYVALRPSYSGWDNPSTLLDIEQDRMEPI